MSSLIISKSKLFSNLESIYNAVNTQIACVIKDNAYGHGIIEISKLLSEFGIKSVFVKNNFEAIKIKDLFDHITILYPTSFDNLNDNIYLSVSDLNHISNITFNTGIELKVNTGMNRNGIEVEDLQKTLELIKKRNLRLIGVFTHNGYGDMDNRNLSDEFLLQQNIFRNVKQVVLDFVNNNNMPLPRFHSLSSSGAIKCREIDDDLVRIGIDMYGYLGVDCDLNLNPIAELWVDKISSRYLKAGSKIGYDGKYVLNNDCIVSSYDIGYGDGLFRLNENHSEMRTKDGSLILPRMSMDATSIISDKDRLCFMHDANEVARIFGTIPYEVLCRISPFIKREIVD